MRRKPKHTKNDEFLTKYIDHSYCSSCGAIASQKAILDAHGATVMEKYCDTSLSI